MYEKSTLSNGVRVITNTMTNTRSVCLAILVGAGSCYETKEEAGISHFAEHLCFKGTHKRPKAKDISQDIEGVGGIINGGTDKELTVFWCKVASSHFELALDVLSDLLLSSRFDKEDIDKERQVIIEEINMNLDIPQQRVNMLIDELLWPEQPLGRDVIGTKESVLATSREKMLSYIASRYLPDNIVVSVAGNIQHKHVLAHVEPLFGPLVSRRLLTGYITDEKQTMDRLCVEHRDSEQVHLCLAVHGFSQSHPMRFALDLLNVVLGGGMSSRLFTEIRENKGLAYDIHSHVEYFINSGALVVYAGIAPDCVETAVTAILRELSKIRKGITASELVRAKEMSKGRLLLRLEDSQNVALWLGSQEMLRRHILSIDEVVSILNAITMKDVKDVAQQILANDGFNLAMVGPVKAEERLAKLIRM